MRVVVIGGSGHIGTYLIPRLISNGHEVINVSRGSHRPYRMSGLWGSVTQVTIDRMIEEKNGTFGKAIRELNPDAVIDLICFTQESGEQLVTGLAGSIQCLLVCGTIWVHGYGTEIPLTEDSPRHPIGDYGIRKAELESFLLREARKNGFPVSILHPGHIVGPGWRPVNPQGNLNLTVFEKLAHGEELVLPNNGLETLHHVHADDVAQSFMRALASFSTARGEAFHIVSEQALTLRGYAEAVASWFGRRANLSFVPWHALKEMLNPEDAAETADHIFHSPSVSIEKAKRLLGYRPRYSSLEAIRESLEWLIAEKEVHV